MVFFPVSIFSLLIYFYNQMDKQKQKEQDERLKKLAEKPVSKEIAKSIAEKTKHIYKPFSK